MPEPEQMREVAKNVKESKADNINPLEVYSGIALRSPNGNVHLTTVTDDGVIITTQVDV